MSDQFLGEIRTTGFTFAPTGWALCTGQILPIAQYTALFSLLGTFYGGNGTSNFQLPNLQGCTPVGQGQLIGGGNYSIGETGGSESVTLTNSEMPQHTHSLFASAAAGKVDVPVATSVLGAVSRGQLGPYVTSPNTTPVSMNINSVGGTGGSNPHNNFMPALTLNYIIALTGIFPQRG